MKSKNINEMNILEQHKSALYEKVSIYHEFLQRYSNTDNKVYGFIEGIEDETFYQRFIGGVLPENWSVELWSVGGRQKVLNLYSLFDWTRFPKLRVCFFLDRDLSDLIPECLVCDMNIYITDGYSIENNIVNEETCRSLLSIVYSCNRFSKTELDKVCELFKFELLVFSHKVASIMAWILYWRQQGKEPYLNNIELKHLFEIHKGKLQVVEPFQDQTMLTKYIHEKCKINKIDNFLPQKYREIVLDDKNPCKWIRGKYLFWFLCQFCESIYRDHGYHFSRAGAKPKKVYSFSEKNGVPLVAGFARCPESLRSFMNSNYLEYVNNSC